MRDVGGGRAKCTGERRSRRAFLFSASAAACETRRVAVASRVFIDTYRALMAFSNLPHPHPVLSSPGGGEGPHLEISFPDKPGRRSRDALVAPRDRCLPHVADAERENSRTRWNMKGSCALIVGRMTGSPAPPHLPPARFFFISFSRVHKTHLSSVVGVRENKRAQTVLGLCGKTCYEMKDERTARFSSNGIKVTR